MRCNQLKAVFHGEGFTMTLDMATDATEPVEVVNQIRRVLQANGFQHVIWTTIHFNERTMETNEIVRGINILGHSARVIDK